ncbi:MAG: hypothetical protein J1G06_09185 [Oscillospiraceae bacterium]|nr:hypothetical protein [Oscillospiraceae bacterium]
MKKFYNEPEMNISMFNVENVVTTSNVEPEPGAPMSAMEKLQATGQLNDVTNKITVTF